MIERRQLGALIFCGLSVPAIVVFPSLDPAKVVAASMLALLLWNCKMQKSLQYGLALTAIFALAILIRWAKQTYPTANAPLALVLLGAAAYSARNGIAPLLRTAAISFCFVTIIYIVIIAFGIGNMTTLRPIAHAPLRWQDAQLIWLLLPWTLCCICRQSPSRGWHLAWFAIAVLPTIVCCLNPGSLRGAFPFYRLTQSISILGIMERFEPILSAALTTGIFLLMAIFAEVSAASLPGRENTALLITVLLSIAVSMLPEEGLTVAMAGLVPIYSGVVPVIIQLVEKRKKSKKSEKSA